MWFSFLLPFHFFLYILSTPFVFGSYVYWKINPIRFPNILNASPAKKKKKIIEEYEHFRTQ